MEMLATAKEYPVEHFLKIGELMSRKGEFDQAIRAYKIVTTAMQQYPNPSPEQLGMDQRALFGIGRAHCEANQYNESVTFLTKLIETYPTTGLFYEARFLIARSYEALNRSSDAIATLRDIFQRAQSQEIINRATVDLARLQLAGGDATGALASCQRVVLLADPGNPNIRPYYEAALVMSVTLLGETEKWEAVTENANRYMKLFPDGKGINEVRKWRTKAHVSTAAETASVEGGDNP